jgi:fumarate reductase subunit D
MGAIVTLFPLSLVVLAVWWFVRMRNRMRQAPAQLTRPMSARVYWGWGAVLAVLAAVGVCAAALAWHRF